MERVQIEYTKEFLEKLVNSIEVFDMVNQTSFLERIDSIDLISRWTKEGVKDSITYVLKTSDGVTGPYSFGENIGYNSSEEKLIDFYRDMIIFYIQTL